MLAEVELSPRPFLKWAGGKAQLLAQMEPFFPKDYRTYFEPFLGGGAAFFSLHPDRATLSDSNPELVTTFVTVRDDPKGLMAALDQHMPRRKEEDYFYEVRAQDPSELSPVERAARTIFLNKTCFNGFVL